MAHSKPLSCRALVLTDELRERGGKKSRRTRARTWKETT